MGKPYKCRVFALSKTVSSIILTFHYCQRPLAKDGSASRNMRLYRDLRSQQSADLCSVRTAGSCFFEGNEVQFKFDLRWTISGEDRAGSSLAEEMTQRKIRVRPALHSACRSG